MPAKTKTLVFARAKHLSSREAAYLGHSDESPDYGVVQVIRSTTTTHYRSDGFENKHRPKEVVEEVLLECDAKQARHLLSTLADAVVDSVTVTKAVSL